MLLAGYINETGKMRVCDVGKITRSGGCGVLFCMSHGVLFRSVFVCDNK